MVVHVNISRVRLHIMVLLISMLFTKKAHSLSRYIPQPVKEDGSPMSDLRSQASHAAEISELNQVQIDQGTGRAESEKKVLGKEHRLEAWILPAYMELIQRASILKQNEKRKLQLDDVAFQNQN